MQERLHQDSEVSSIEDTDEDMSTTEIEDDWIEYLKRSRRRADEKMRTLNTFLLDYDTQKDEMDISNEDIFSAWSRWSKKIANWCLYLTHL